MTDNPKRPSPEKVTLLTGVSVLKEFHDELLTHVLARIQQLKYGEVYEAQDLVQPSYWASLDNAAHWRIGCCVADWERAKKLPLRFVGCDLCKVRHYERT